MAKDHLQFGETRVDVLHDGVIGVPRPILLHNGGEAALASAQARLSDDDLLLDINGFLLRGPRGIELVDVGAGLNRGADYGHARNAMAAHGVMPDAVDRILITHMHFDHALGLIDGDVPYFPNAEVIVPAADLDFYTDPAERARRPPEWHQTFDEASRVAAVCAGQLRRAAFGPLMPGVELIPIPGHSPGQGAYAFTADGGTLLLFGDLLHFGEQAADPDLGTGWDNDGDAAARSRREVLGRAADGGWIVGGGHLRGFGRVARDGGAFRILPL